MSVKGVVPLSGAGHGEAKAIMNQEIKELRRKLVSYPDMIREETEGLSFEQMAFADREPGWARWSIDLHIRHMAQIPCTWLCVEESENLRAAGYSFPPSTEALVKNRLSGSRLVSPEIAPHRQALLELLKEWSDFCCLIVDQEGPEGLRRIEIHRYVDPEEQRPGDPKKSIEYTRLDAQLHPTGYTEDPNQPGHFIIELGTALGHFYWNMLAHLRNIQRIKSLMGIHPALELPREGYLKFSEFYD
jgi:hypothetical protein